MISLYELKDRPEWLSALKDLLKQYGDYMYSELKLVAGIDTFYKDLDNMPGHKFSYPEGTFILAFFQEELVGCAGIKKFTDADCEMKRMFIKPAFRGMNIGKLLCDEVISVAKKLNYHRILLDTNLEMSHAVNLYKSKGFTVIPPYCVNENDHPIYMQYVITQNILE